MKSKSDMPDKLDGSKPKRDMSVELDGSKSPACMNCSKIANEVRDWQAFMNKATLRRDPPVDISPWKMFLEATECPTCIQLVQSFSVAAWFPHGSVQLTSCCDPEDVLRIEISSYPSFVLDLFPWGSLPTPSRHQLEMDKRGIDIPRLKEWITYCDTQHAGICHGPTLEPCFLTPSEILLIDVTDYKLKRCFTKERYAALSYVWGESKTQFESTISNIAELLKPGSLRTHWEKLPATIRDAISLTNTLEVPFLWVDRLCIVQDDQKSKDHNISWMASIYANAYFTIIAAEGDDADSGIRGIGTASGPRRYGNLTLQFEDLTFKSVTREGFGTWHERGWTFQERAISRRSLVFSADRPCDTTVHWECQKTLLRENLASLRDYELNMTEYVNISFREWPDFDQYRSLCFSFSGRKLRYPEDAERAFIAITNGLTTGFPGGFLYAMPEFCFDLALMWKHDAIGSRRSMFPSWSWLGWYDTPHMPICDPLSVWEGRDNDWEGLSVRSPPDTLQSLGLWRKRNVVTDEFITIANEFSFWNAFATERQQEPPKGWTRVTMDDSMFYQYDGSHSGDLAGKKFNHPLPVSKFRPIAPDAQQWDRRLYGTVLCYTFAFGQSDQPYSIYDLYNSVYVHIVDVNQQVIGFVQLDSGGSSYEQGRDCTLIAISRVTKTRSPHDLPGEYSSSNYFLKIQDKRPYEYIAVLWISWENEEAVRQGCGEILATEWDRHPARKMEIVLA